jgi:hypothetical protein
MCKSRVGSGNKEGGRLLDNDLAVGSREECSASSSMVTRTGDVRLVPYSSSIAVTEQQQRSRAEKQDGKDETS